MGSSITGLPSASMTRPVITPPRASLKSIFSTASSADKFTMCPGMYAFEAGITNVGATAATLAWPGANPLMRYFPSASETAWPSMVCG